MNSNSIRHIIMLLIWSHINIHGLFLLWLKLTLYEIIVAMRTYVMTYVHGIWIVNVTLRSSRNSEAKASEFLENLKAIFSSELHTL